MNRRRSSQNRGIGPEEPRGQILPGSRFGDLLTTLARQAETIVEIGTWHGTGSTRCLANGLVRATQKFWTVENLPDLWQEAKDRYKNDPRVICLRGLTRDLISELPPEIDLILFDGGDNSTDQEFDLLLPRLKVVALDDTKVEKNIRQRRVLLACGWKVIADVQNERNGWAVFERTPTCNMNEFEAIYQNGGWDGKGSGPGSTEAFTAGFRKVFETLLQTLNIRSIFDLGCGDWQWQRHVRWEQMNYTGWDMSKVALESIDVGPQTFARFNQLRFELKEAFAEPLWPSTDLLLVKDVVHHIAPYQVRTLMEQAKRYKYVLWVVDIDATTRLAVNCPKGDFMQHWTQVYAFDMAVESCRYGPKVAFLQTNP